MDGIENERKTKLLNEIATAITRFTNGDTDFPRSSEQEGLPLEEVYQNLVEQGTTKALKSYITEVGKELKQGEERTLAVLDKLDLYADIFYPEELAYKLGEGISSMYISIQRVEDGYDYSVVNRDWGEFDGGVYDDTSITIYEVLNEIVFGEYDPLLKDAKNMVEVDFDALRERVDDVAMGNIQERLDDEKYTLGISFENENKVYSFDMRDLLLQDEKSFLQCAEDSFAIYQVKNGEEFHNYRFTNMKGLNRESKEILEGNYDFVYFSPLDTLKINEVEDKNAVLNQIFYVFNTDLPDRYHGRSVSVSDVIALNQGGKVSCHFVDSYGFQEVKNFINPQAINREGKDNQSIMKDILQAIQRENARKEQQNSQKKNKNEER